MARLFATLVLLLPSLALGGPIEQAYAAFSRGREAAAAGELPAAETAYREALAHAPGWILPDLELAELALKYSSRISELRGYGADIVMVERNEDGDNVYQLINVEHVAHLLDGGDGGLD